MTNIFLAWCACVASLALPISGRADASAVPNFPPLCSSKNIWAANGGISGAMMHEYDWIVFVNLGRTSCRLAGYPVIQGKGIHGFVRLNPIHDATVSGTFKPTELAPRMAGEMVIATDSSCGLINSANYKRNLRIESEHTYTELYLYLPGGKGSVLVSGLNLDIACGMVIGPLGWRTTS
jgi:hypothetical protein